MTGGKRFRVRQDGVRQHRGVERLSQWTLTICCTTLKHSSRSVAQLVFSAFQAAALSRGLIGYGSAIRALARHRSVRAGPLVCDSEKDHSETEAQHSGQADNPSLRRRLGKIWERRRAPVEDIQARWGSKGARKASSPGRRSIFAVSLACKWFILKNFLQ